MSLSGRLEHVSILTAEGAASGLHPSTALVSMSGLQALSAAAKSGASQWYHRSLARAFALFGQERPNSALLTEASQVHKVLLDGQLPRAELRSGACKASSEQQAPAPTVKIVHEKETTVFTPGQVRHKRASISSSASIKRSLPAGSAFYRARRSGLKGTPQANKQGFAQTTKGVTTNLEKPVESKPSSAIEGDAGGPEKFAGSCGKQSRRRHPLLSSLAAVGEQIGGAQGLKTTEQEHQDILAAKYIVRRFGRKAAHRAAKAFDHAYKHRGAASRASTYYSQ